MVLNSATGSEVIGRRRSFLLRKRKGRHQVNNVIFFFLHARIDFCGINTSSGAVAETIFCQAVIIGLVGRLNNVMISSSTSTCVPLNVRPPLVHLESDVTIRSFLLMNDA